MYCLATNNKQASHFLSFQLSNNMSKLVFVVWFANIFNANLIGEHLEASFWQFKYFTVSNSADGSFNSLQKRNLQDFGKKLNVRLTSTHNPWHKCHKLKILTVFSFFSRVFDEWNQINFTSLLHVNPFLFSVFFFCCFHRNISFFYTKFSHLRQFIFVCRIFFLFSLTNYHTPKNFFLFFFSFNFRARVIFPLCSS